IDLPTVLNAELALLPSMDTWERPTRSRTRMPKAIHAAWETRLPFSCPEGIRTGLLQSGQRRVVPTCFSVTGNFIRHHGHSTTIPGLGEADEAGMSSLGISTWNRHSGHGIAEVVFCSGA